MWECEGTQHLRPNIAQPTNRCAERLLARVVPEVPAPPHILGYTDVIADLAGDIDPVLDNNDTVVIGVDGSELTTVSAWAAAVHMGGSHASGVASEDQSAYRAEAVLRAALITRRDGSLLMVADCQAARQATEGKGCCSLLVREVRGLYADSACRYVGSLVMISWPRRDGWCRLVGRSSRG